MTRKYTADFSDEQSGKKTTIEYENSSVNEGNNQRLLELVSSPWQLIKEGGKLGVKGIKRFFGLLFLFGTINGLLLLVAVVKLLLNEINRNNLIGLGLVALVGVVALYYTAYRAYQYVLLDTIRVIYENLAPFFQKVCSIIVDKTEKLFTSKNSLNNSTLAKTIDFSKLVYEQFQKTPKFIRGGIVMVLEKIPFTGMLMEFKDDISEGRKEDASQKLFQKMDDFIQNTIFGSNNTQWVWWLLPLNIVVTLVLIIAMIK
ncbi:hypothetical protein BKI52_27205 [marine bacterium AO1-C]|nr:hypothetical protein BKI52_27205 [marine bacterium AO1-C]